MILHTYIHLIQVWWAASDLGWVVGHSYICYAPLLHGNSTILYEVCSFSSRQASKETSEIMQTTQNKSGLHNKLLTAVFRYVHKLDQDNVMYSCEVDGHMIYT